jgi:hypothetical protein
MVLLNSLDSACFSRQRKFFLYEIKFTSLNDRMMASKGNYRLKWASATKRLAWYSPHFHGLWLVLDLDLVRNWS